MRSQAQHSRFASLRRLCRPGLFVWALVLAGSFHWPIAYQMRAGLAAPALAGWPAGAGIEFDSRRYNLIMFAHPKCPCTRASLDELEVLLTRRRGEIRATVCFIAPENAPASWTDSSLERSAGRFPREAVV